ncbi:hypothetical protein IHE45_19G086400 [Dioscorea alata]|uniref:Uncharacterized protein n=1 Tax=Dioscorea alata TaxID=55571 RepID=A0ACB7TZU6_DIOAL|nr:hypothetical protein IHE45_19G086400 [Dioscorea alata]
MASNQDNLKHEVHNLLTSLNNHQETGLRDTGESGNSVRIITLAGTNQGASMRSARIDHEIVNDNGVLYGFEDKLIMRACTNSNFQAVTNCLMLKGRCTAGDPGVHLEFSEDFVDDHGDEKEKRNESTNR